VLGESVVRLTVESSWSSSSSSSSPASDELSSSSPSSAFAISPIVGPHATIPIDPGSARPPSHTHRAVMNR